MVQTDGTGAFICRGTTENGGRGYTRRWSDMSERTANRLVIIGAGALRSRLRAKRAPRERFQVEAREANSFANRSPRNFTDSRGLATQDKLPHGSLGVVVRASNRRKEVRIPASQGARRKTHSGRNKVHRLVHDAHMLQDKRVCDSLIFPRHPLEARRQDD